MTGEFLAYGQTGKGLDCFYKFIMTVNMQIAFILGFVHACGDHTDHPDHAENMVIMGMGHKDVMNLFQRNVLFFQGEKNAIAAAGIGKKVFIAAFHGKAGIIAVDGLGISSAENN